MTERVRTGGEASTPPKGRPPPLPCPRLPPPCSLRLLPRAVLLLCPVHLSMGRRRECLAVLGRVVTRGGRCPPRPHGAELPRQPVSRQAVSPPLPVTLLEGVSINSPVNALSIIISAAISLASSLSSRYSIIWLLTCFIFSTNKSHDSLPPNFASFIL